MSAPLQRPGWKRWYLGPPRCLSARHMDTHACQRGCRRQEQTSLSIWTLSVYVGQRSVPTGSRHVGQRAPCALSQMKNQTSLLIPDFQTVNHSRLNTFHLNVTHTKA